MDAYIPVRFILWQAISGRLCFVLLEHNIFSEKDLKTWLRIRREVTFGLRRDCISDVDDDEGDRHFGTSL